jgi:hypothetical protein
LEGVVVNRFGVPYYGLLVAASFVFGIVLGCSCVLVEEFVGPSPGVGWLNHHISVFIGLLMVGVLIRLLVESWAARTEKPSPTDEQGL